MMHQAAPDTYPGLERELQQQNETKHGSMALPMHTPANSPLAARQRKPGEQLGAFVGPLLTASLLQLSAPIPACKCARLIQTARLQGLVSTVGTLP